MSQKRRRINARMPEPNDNFSMTMGNKGIVDAVFRDTGLDCFLDGLKRNQGESVSNEIKALVANSVEMTGVSVNRLDRLMESPHFRTEYGLGGGAPGPCIVLWRGWGSIPTRSFSSWEGD